jgi:hypothetical protein
MKYVHRYNDYIFEDEVESTLFRQIRCVKLSAFAEKRRMRVFGDSAIFTKL